MSALGGRRPIGTTKTSQLATLVWVHGGEFSIGGTRDYDGEGIALYDGVIIASINYRLGLRRCGGHRWWWGGKLHISAM